MPRFSLDLKKIIVLLFISLIIIGGGVMLLSGKKTAPKDRKVETVPMLYTDKELFLWAISKARTQKVGNVSGVTVPHHLLAIDMIADGFKVVASSSYDLIVVLSPDHYWLGSRTFSVTTRNFATIFGKIKSDQEITNELKQLPSVGEGDFFYREHGIQAMLPFIKYYFPSTTVLAISMKENARKAEIDELVDVLEKNLPKRTLIIQSTDFSHYLTKDEANAKDDETIDILRKYQADRILSLVQPDHIDSNAAQYVQLKLQRDLYNSNLDILAHKNSADYTKDFVSSTTSYIVEVWKY